MEEIKRNDPEKEARSILDQMEALIGIVPVEEDDTDPRGVVTGTGILIGFVMGVLLTTILYAWATAGGLEMILCAI